MNTKPADESLALWMEGELDGPELARVEAWVAGHPELLAEREALAAWKSELGAALPAVEEPPYPDFFNTRIERTIRDSMVAETRSAPAGKRAVWRGFLWVPGAAAAMAVCFWIGTEVGGGASGDAVAAAPPEAAPLVYTPFQGVTAEVVTASGAGGTVIVLEGLAAMPDTLEFLDTAALVGEEFLVSMPGKGIY